MTTLTAAARKENKKFIATVWQYYKEHRRSMSWRETITPYRVVVSEIMLQQTQADRVAKKFDVFIQRFPDWETLANAPTKDLLQEWQGLGYNRRALNLQKCARAIHTQYNEKLPKTHEELVELPGLGPHTAGSILAFAWNLPHPFIETNIRSVYIHHFWNNTSHKTSHTSQKLPQKIHDRDILTKVTETLDHTNPREWYYALMDYGTHLKKIHKNPSRRSLHHKPQTAFKGSHRELRAHIIKLLIIKPLSYTDLIAQLTKWRPTLAVEEAERAIEALEYEGFIKNSSRGIYTIA